MKKLLKALRQAISHRANAVAAAKEVHGHPDNTGLDHAHAVSFRTELPFIAITVQLKEAPIGFERIVASFKPMCVVSHHADEDQRCFVFNFHRECHEISFYLHARQAATVHFHRQPQQATPPTPVKVRELTPEEEAQWRRKN